MEIEIDYDIDSKELPENYYPNPMNDWFVIVRIPKQSNWEDTKKIANETRDKIREALK